MCEKKTENIEIKYSDYAVLISRNHSEIIKNNFFAGYFCMCVFLLRLLHVEAIASFASFMYHDIGASNALPPSLGCIPFYACNAAHGAHNAANDGRYSHKERA